MITTPDLNVGIDVTAKDSTEEGLAAAKESLRTFMDAATQAGDEFVSSSDGMSKAAIEVGESCSIAEHNMKENAQTVREATRDFKLMNIEEMQYNQILQMTAGTAIQWGQTLQGQHSLVKTAINGFVEALDKATGGFSTYIGAGIQVAGMIVNMYAQYSRMVIMWGMHAAAVAADAAAQDVNTASTAAAIPVQLGLNAAMLANPAVLNATGFAAAAVAIGVGVAAMNSYKSVQEEMNQKITEMGNRVIKLKADLQNLYAGENDDVRSIMAKRDDEQKQLVEMGEEYEAARQIGNQAKVDELDGLMRVKIANVELYDQMEKNARKAGPDIVELGKAWAGMAHEASSAFEEAGQLKFSMADFRDDKKMAALHKEAREWGEKVADAYIDGLQDGFTSPENQKILNDAIDKYHLPMQGHSPPTVGPLRFVEEWGENIVAAYNVGMTTGFSSLENNLSRELEVRVGSQLSRGGGNNNIVNNTSESKSNMSVTFNISGVDEESIARNILRKLSAMMG